ncbi:uncharacterized protein LOC111390396 [Olea europaea var. sylvestris]|uniref:uncharacterized protein LOC111390396 n=1 Tax=Olea europaea var. sylvestris TaxID=158386 RepID=UPI000C1CFA35|nr:uncharacterized protein LOC111390396 [Olea europaea var. sylvestris]
METISSKKEYQVWGRCFNNMCRRWTRCCSKLTRTFKSTASIKKLETQIDQIAQQLAEHLQGTLPGNTMINPKERVMAIKIVENCLPRAPVKVKVYIPPLPFSQKLRKKLMEQNIHVINTKIEVQSPKITTKRPKRKYDQEVIDETTRVEKFAPNATENGESTETSAVKTPSLDKAYMPLIPFPQNLKKNKQDTNYEKFFDVLKKLQINVSFTDTILQIPSYTKFLREMLTKKRKFPEFETMALTKESSARVQRKLPPKLKDPRSFTLPISIGNSCSINALCDTGANINLMSYSTYRKLVLGEVNSTSITLQLADKIIARPHDKVEDVLVKVGNLIFPVDFIVLDIPEDQDFPIILGRPFLATGRTLIDMEKGELILRMEDKQKIFNIYTQYEKPPNKNDSCRIDKEEPPDQRSYQKKKTKIWGTSWNMTSRNTQTSIYMKKMGQISSLRENVEEESIKCNTKAPQHHRFS